jgi:nucleoside-diphosphate-sugar epimerase
MGPSLVGRLCRAAAKSSRKIYAAGRFTSRQALAEVREAGAEPIVCDLHNPEEVSKLPAAENVFYLAGRKFGSTGRPDLTWAANAIVPALTGWHCKSSRIVVFSSGNVYPFVDVTYSSGAKESDATDPKGEYAQSALARERIFDYYSHEYGTRCLILRLNYAVDLRYGTLVDIALRVWRQLPVPLRMSRVNAIWQGDANRYAILALDACQSPALTLNVTGPEIVDVAATARWFGERFNRPVQYEGAPGPTALLNDASECFRQFGNPEVDLTTLREWVAQWIESGGDLLDKPTNFEVVDGRF